MGKLIIHFPTDHWLSLDMLTVTPPTDPVAGLTPPTWLLLLRDSLSLPVTSLPPSLSV